MQAETGSSHPGGDETERVMPPAYLCVAILLKEEYRANVECTCNADVPAVHTTGNTDEFYSTAKRKQGEG